MQAVISMTGPDAGLASEREMAMAIKAAAEVFDKRGADPLAAAQANDKRSRDERLTRDEALLCVVWDEAEYAAWHAMTHGWLVRDIDVSLALRKAA